MGENWERVAERVKGEGLVAIIRGDFPPARVLEIGETVLEGGVTILEVTLNSGNALEAIGALRRRFEGRMLIGAGTVRTAAHVDAALGAGAEFMVAPSFDAQSVAQAQARDVLHVPGVFTPTEAQTAFAAGCRMVKLFPSDVVGPAYLKALRAPLNDIEFMPTGGISAENVGQYVKAGAVAVGIGSALITGPSQPREELLGRAKALRAAWERARHG